MKKILHYIGLVIAALAILSIIAAVIFYIANSDLRAIEQRDREDSAYKKVAAEKKDKEQDKKSDKKDKQKKDTQQDKQKSDSKDNQSKDNKKKDKQQEEEEVTFKESAKYTPESLAEIIGDLEKYSTRYFEIGEEKCLNYWFAGKKIEDEDRYDECNYYLFEDKKSAKKAFNYMKEYWISNETDSGNTFIRGWEEGVCDASVEIFIYHTNNMIITAEVQVVSEWATPVDSDESYDAPVANYERIDFIKSHF